MKKTQLMTAGLVLVAVVCLYAATHNQIFGHHLKEVHQNTNAGSSTVSTDSIWVHAKENLTPTQATRLNFLENSITRGNVPTQKIHVYHQLARFWKDSVHVFEPYAWYTAEAARLENSENSLTFAAHLFLDNLKGEENPALRNWKALQAKDLFERSLKINPANDSSQISLGLVHLYGGVGTPMEGIGKIRSVADQHPENVYAQMSLGHASVVSGQFDKAAERFEKVLKAEPGNIEAILSLADLYERTDNVERSIEWYRKSLPFIKIPALKDEVEKRIAQLEKK